MLMPLLCLSLAPLFVPTCPVSLIQRVVGAPPPATIALRTADSSVVPGHVPLTAELLTRYIALKKDLNAFWLTHQPLLDTAKAHAHVQVVAAVVGGMRGVDHVHVFDYVALTAHDTALAALFTKHHVLPRQFEPTEDAAYAALLALVASIQTGTPLDTTDIIQKNAVLVQAQRQTLADVGVHEEEPQ